MFITLLMKECKYTLKSLTYYLIIIALVLFYYSNDDSTLVTKPAVSQMDYGIKYGDDEISIMNNTLDKLANSVYDNTFIGYPFGFYKEVKLNEEKLDKVKIILEELSGKTYSNIEEDLGSGKTILVKERILYSEFTDRMKEIDKLLGGRSGFEPSGLKYNNMIPMSYEDALKLYDSIIMDDQISNAYARLFSDYLGLILGILPVFLIITRSLRDKRAQVTEVIYTKNISSLAIVLSRYLSGIIMIVVPVIVLSISPTLECIYFANSIGVPVDYLAFVNHILGWILPTILFITALAYFITELTRSAVGILICGVFWIINIFGSFNNLVGSVGMNLVPRFNTVGERYIFDEIYKQLILNRSIYTVLSILIVIATVVVYQLRREGVIGYDRKLFCRNKG